MRHPLTKYFDNISRLSLGCMGFGGDWNSEPYSSEHVQQMHSAIDAAMDAGINFFDHADIYTMNKAELVFGEVLKQRPELKDEIVIQSKCGIRFEDESAPGRYDFSKNYVMNSVDGILQRLGIEQLDILLLHRPDPLMELDELTDALFQLKASGKVAHFGVSNMHAHQIAYLQSGMDFPIIVNQMEMSLKNLDWLNEGVTAGMTAGHSVHFSPGIVEHCQSNDIQIQAWGCLAQGLYSGRDLAGMPQNIIDTAGLVAHMAHSFGVSREAIVLAWLMRHPAKIQPIIGTTNPDRIRACAQAEPVELSREQWYQLYVASRGDRLP